MTEMVIGLVVPHDATTAIRKTEFNQLADYQQAVGGFIETVQLPEHPLVIVANEDGKMQRLPINLRATLLWWLLNPAGMGSDMLMGVLDEELPNPKSAVMRAWKWRKANPVLDCKPEAILIKPVRQVQRRLKPDEELLVVGAYLSGQSTYKVGADFGIHRTTVSAIMQRQGVKMRRQKKRPYRRQSQA